MIERGLETQETADHIGVNRGTLKRWRHLQNDPYLSHAIELADLLYVTLDELVGRVSPLDPAAAVADQAAAGSRRRGDEQQHRLAPRGEPPADAAPRPGGPTK